MDKPSWQNAEGRPVAAYRNDASYHCHLADIRADPILAYTQIAPDRLVPDYLVLVGITTHRPMLNGDRRACVRDYVPRFPNPLRRRPLAASRTPTKDDDTD